MLSRRIGIFKPEDPRRNVAAKTQNFELKPGRRLNVLTFQRSNISLVYQKMSGSSRSISSRLRQVREHTAISARPTGQ